MLRYEHGGDVYSHENIKLDFSVNLNPLGMPRAVREAIAAAADACARYPDPHSRALCAAVANSEGVQPESVLCGNGAADLIFRLCLAVRPKCALVCAPTFSEYEKAALLAGAQMRFLTLRENEGFRTTGRLLDELVPGVDMLFICNPNNPTGALMDTKLLEETASRCNRLGITLVVDECFLAFTDGVSAKPLMKRYKNVVVLNAFTKLYAMPGVRLGYLISSDPALLEKTAAAAQSWSVSSVAQAAGLAALSVEGWSERTRDVVKTEARYLADALARPGLCVFEGSANFLLIKSERPLYAPLLKKGILIRPCANYRGLDDRFYRVGVKGRRENDLLIQAVDKV